VRNTLIVVFGLCMLAVSSRASAQATARGEPDVSRVRVRLGRLFLNPTVSLTNLGWDTNVFNEPDQAEPKRDFTLTLSPQTELWLRMGRAWLTGAVKEDLVWYKTYAGERSLNNSAGVGLVLPLNRLKFSGGTGYLRTRDRPGYEIDARSQRSELAYDGAVEIRARPKTFIGVRAERKITRFDSAATFEGVSLREALNRTATIEAVTIRQQVTPLTAITLDFGRAQDRFQFSPLRDSDSTSAAVGVKLDGFAIIKGSASFGYRDFQPVLQTLPAYKGTTATADLAYVAFGTMRLGVQVLRDVQYSFEINEPYYLLTGVSASVTQRISRPLDIVGRIGRQRLSYRERLGAFAAARDRIDHVRSYGGGVGYHLGDVRIGFNVDQQKRSSPVFDRDYHGLRFGTSVTYGL
jgi:hypothetical protein